MEVFTGFVIAIFVVVCVLLVGVILLQEGERPSADAFGARSVFGGKTSAVFARSTRWLAISFMVLSLFLMKFYGENSTGQLKAPRIQQITTGTQSSEEAPNSDAKTETAGVGLETKSKSETSTKDQPSDE